jgi:hypothetical protein
MITLAAACVSAGAVISIRSGQLLLKLMELA